MAIKGINRLFAQKHEEGGISCGKGLEPERENSKMSAYAKMVAKRANPITPRLTLAGRAIEHIKSP
jgi:hypothetical protein